MELFPQKQWKEFPLFRPVLVPDRISPPVDINQQVALWVYLPFFFFFLVRKYLGDGYRSEVRLTKLWHRVGPEGVLTFCLPL